MFFKIYGNVTLIPKFVFTVIRCLDLENLEKGEAQWKRVSTAGLINPRYGHQTVYLHGYVY